MKKLSAAIMAIIMVLAVITVPAKAQAAEYSIHAPERAADGTVTYSCVYFGSYWQSLEMLEKNKQGRVDESEFSKLTESDKEPIKWRVLSIEGNTALLLADQALVRKPYDEIISTETTWANCTLRSWLNGYSSGSNAAGLSYETDSFIGSAFSADEQAAIVVKEQDNSDFVLPAQAGPVKMAFEGCENTFDKVFLLRAEDLAKEEYGFSYYDNERGNFGMATLGTATVDMVYDYAKLRSRTEYASWPLICDSKPQPWLLRTPASVTGYTGRAASAVRYDGFVRYDINPAGRDCYYANQKRPVVPAVYLDLTKADVWSVAEEYICQGLKPGGTYDVNSTGCNHSWGSRVVIEEATCSDDGLEYVTCANCELTTKRVIPATGNHSWEVMGNRKICSVCGQAEASDTAVTDPATEQSTDKNTTEDSNNKKLPEKTTETTDGNDTKDGSAAKLSKSSWVTGFKVTSKKKALKLSWKKVKGASGYEIQYGTNKNFKKVKTVKASVTKKTYTIKGLKPKKKYYLRIRAYDKGGRTNIWIQTSKKTK